MASSLPETPSQLKIILVRRQGVNGFKDFRVRRAKVLSALLWLQSNNPLYSDIIINQHEIENLPIDGDISNNMTYFREDGWSAEPIREDSITEDSVPIAPHQRQETLAKNTILWPEADPNPINEFRNCGYIPRAFPHLFPYGVCDYLDYTRTSKVTFKEWCQHLLRLSDKRFAQDPRFRFFCLNTMLRHEALENGSVFVKLNDRISNVEELKMKIEQNPNYMKKLLYWGSKIRGSSAYWYQRNLELKDMVNQIGVPTIFATLSAADLWWPCLIKHFGLNREQISTISDKDHSKVVQKLLNDNPLIADEYFCKRTEIFLKVLREKYPINDYWYRYEYQHRGSPHVHGVYWIQDAPDVREFDNLSPEAINSVREYYDRLVSAYNPDQSAAPATQHPCRLNCVDITLNDVTKAQLINRVQRHTQHGTQCLRGPRKECRFKYPKDILPNSTLAKDDKGIWTYTPARNDPLVNDYNPFILHSWRANTDCQIISSEHAIVSYISKYASKAEPQSEDIKELFKRMIEECNNDQGAAKIVSKLLIKLVGQRDVSACETMHLLISEPLYHCSRKFVRLYLGEEKYVAIRQNEDDNTTSYGKKMIDAYKTRPISEENLTLQKFAERYSIVGSRISKNRINRVVQVMPRITPGRSSDSDENYFKQKLIMHVPFRESDDLKTHETWKISYEQRNLNLWELQSQRDDDEDEDVYDDIYEQPDMEQREWMSLCGAHPAIAPTDVDLGYRDFDREFDWYQAYNKYPQIEEYLNFVQNCKEQSISRRNNIEAENINLNGEQKKILDHLEQQLKDENVPKFSIVTGPAGTGKSYVVRAITQKVEATYGAHSVLIMAPTGVAANNINGQTIHSGLRFTSLRLGALSGEQERDFQEQMSYIRVVIIDEFSMVGLKMLGKINERLRQANPEKQNETMGGYIVYLFGDFNQLQPVGDQLLYANPIGELAILGKLAYLQFTKVFFLEEIMRQVGDEQIRFKEILQHFALGTLTVDDYELLQKRFSVNNVQLKVEFENALRIISRNEVISEYNYDQLRRLGNPVTVIRADNNNSTASNAKTDKAHGLENLLRLSKGVQVILRQNLWTEKGLCNGTIGIVQDIIYKPGTIGSHLDDTPICILVKFKKYTGPTLYNGCVPILRRTVAFKSEGITCTRKQFPLQLSYAISVHRAQGLTLDQAVLDIGDSEFALGLSYVAFSRVKTITGLLIDPAFGWDRLVKINQKKGLAKKLEELQRLRSLS